MKNIEDYEHSPVIEINDIGIITSAVINGFEILSTNKDPKNAPRVSFLFYKTKKLEELIEKYFKSELPVDAKTFLTTLRDIKSHVKVSY